MIDRLRSRLVELLSVALGLFCLAEVNYPRLDPTSQLAIFAALGLVLCFLIFPAAERLRGTRSGHGLDAVLILATIFCCAYVALQSEPFFERWWLAGQSLGDRAGAEQPLDFAVGILGLLVVLEGARRSVGLALPILAITFLTYAFFGPSLPSWLFPHRGYGVERLVSQTFLHSQGVFGVALRVMFVYVFLFVLFGAALEITGATRFVIDLARRLFRGSAGAPAKVAVLASGLMGSLSGSAVANTATTGTFTIPLMRSAGFKRHIAAGIEAAASSGGALVPPVMGAGAYMMLEIIDPPVTYLTIIRAALLPAVLYYLSLFLIVHFSANRIVAGDETDDSTVPEEPTTGSAPPMAGVVFFIGLGALIAFLLSGSTVFRSVSLALAVVLGLAALSSATRPNPRRLLTAFTKAAKGGVALIAAAASVGIVLGVVTLTGIGTRLPATILPLAEHNLLLALLLLMVSSIVLGMGLPSAVCYLLLATLVGPALGGLGVAPLAAHLFIFYFGLMSMVTPPVALAAYTAASIAGSSIMKTSFAAFRFSLIGFALPFLFVYRPQLLLYSPEGTAAIPINVGIAFTLTALCVVPLAASMTGYFLGPVRLVERGLLLLAALALFQPAPVGTLGALPVSWINLAGLVVTVGIAWLSRRRGVQG